MKASSANYIVLDIGSSKISGIASNIGNSDKTRILSQHISRSEGFRSGNIINLKHLEDSILSIISKLEKDCDKSIEKATVVVSGFGAKSFYLYHKQNLENTEITKEIKSSLIKNAISKFKEDKYRIIHYFPIEFTINNSNHVQDPLGMIAYEIGVKLHIIATDVNLIFNLVNCMSKCQIEISNIILSVYASGKACLTEDERNLGSVLIDMGSHTTAYAIFFGKKLIYTSHIRLGGWHITSDIAKAFSLSIEVAEKLKTLYGTTLHHKDRDNVINIEDFGHDLESSYDVNITTSALASVIIPRVDEIMELIKTDYDKIGIDHLIARRIVITGGGAALRGMKERISSIFQRQVRIGKPMIFPGFIDEDRNNLLYSAAIGAIQTKISFAQRKNEIFNDVGYNEPKSGVLNKIITWIKENI